MQKEKKFGYAIKVFVTHTKVHPDEVLDFLLLVLYGEKIYPGTSSAEAQFVDAGSAATVHPTDWAHRGIFPVGVWGSEFDEHGRDRGISSSLLLARKLGVERHPDVAHIIRYVNRVDTEGGAKKDELPTLLKLVHDMANISDREAFNWCLTALSAKVGDITDPQNFSVDYIKQLIANQECSAVAESWYEIATHARQYQALQNNIAKGLVRKAQKSIVKLPTGHRLLVIETDNRQVGPVAFSYYKCADVVVMRNPTVGHVAILTRKGSNANLTMVAAVLNMRENIAFANTVPLQSRKGVVHGFRKCMQDTIKEGVMRNGRWCNYGNGMWVMNGSASAPNVRPTRLSLGSIVNTVISFVRKTDEHIRIRDLHNMYTKTIALYCEDATKVLVKKQGQRGCLTAMKKPKLGDVLQERLRCK